MWLIDASHSLQTIHKHLSFYPSGSAMPYHTMASSLAIGVFACNLTLSVCMCMCVCVCVCVSVCACVRWGHLPVFQVRSKYNLFLEWETLGQVQPKVEAEPDVLLLFVSFCQAPLSLGFSRQQYWCGLPFPSPGDLPVSDIEPASLASSALAGEFFTTAPPGKRTVLMLI